SACNAARLSLRSTRAIFRTTFTSASSIRAECVIFFFQAEDGIRDVANANHVVGRVALQHASRLDEALALLSSRALGVGGGRLWLDLPHLLPDLPDLLFAHPLRSGVYPARDM